MLYKYKDAFSLREEVDTSQNKELEIDVTDKSSFFIRPDHVKKEDKAIPVKEMKRLCF